MATTTKLDENGRVYIPAEIRRKIDAEEFKLIPYADRIELRPVSEDPLAKLREALEGVDLDANSEAKATEQFNESRGLDNK